MSSNERVGFLTAGFVLLIVFLPLQHILSTFKLWVSILMMIMVVVAWALVATGLTFEPYQGAWTHDKQVAQDWLGSLGVALVIVASIVLRYVRNSPIAFWICAAMMLVGWAGIVASLVNASPQWVDESAGRRAAELVIPLMGAAVVLSGLSLLSITEGMPLKSETFGGGNKGTKANYLGHSSGLLRTFGALATSAGLFSLWGSGMLYDSTHIEAPPEREA